MKPHSNSGLCNQCGVQLVHGVLHNCQARIDHQQFFARQGYVDRTYTATEEEHAVLANTLRELRLSKNNHY